MEPREIIQELWVRAQAHDWAGFGELLADDLVVEWPVSAERIVGGDNYVRVTAEYPAGWTLRVLRVVADGEVVVSEIEVVHDTLGIHRAASFWTVRDDKIVAGREYWTQPGSDPSPQWRSSYVERV
jgi:ketosteroid isomerase-like protein